MNAATSWSQNQSAKNFFIVQTPVVLLIRTLAISAGSGVLSPALVHIVASQGYVVSVGCRLTVSYICHTKTYAVNTKDDEVEKTEATRKTPRSRAKYASPTSFRLEKSILKLIDARARKLGLTRSKLVAMILRSYTERDDIIGIRTVIETESSHAVTDILG